VGRLAAAADLVIATMALVKPGRRETRDRRSPPELASHQSGGGNGRILQEEIPPGPASVSESSLAADLRAREGRRTRRDRRWLVGGIAYALHGAGLLLVSIGAVGYFGSDFNVIAAIVLLIGLMSLQQSWTAFRAHLGEQGGAAAHAPLS